jgi:uncharacterized protein YbaR (Trm112 family)
MIVLPFTALSPGPSWRLGCVSIHRQLDAVTARAEMVNPELLEILVCPETKQTLSVAGTDTLTRVNQAIVEGRLVNQGGDRVKDRIEEGLVREDGRVLYPVRDGIPVMLLDEAVRLDTLS